jgi:hypothetical protein
MWIPGCAVYALVAAWLFAGWVDGPQADVEGDLVVDMPEGAPC